MATVFLCDGISSFRHLFNAHGLPLRWLSSFRVISRWWWCSVILTLLEFVQPPKNMHRLHSVLWRDTA
jgi:hypothetical protein